MCVLVVLINLARQLKLPSGHYLCNEYCCKKKYQIDLFLLERIEKKERIDLASMIFTNSNADREGIKKKEHFINLFPTSIIMPNAPSICY